MQDFVFVFVLPPLFFGLYFAQILSEIKAGVKSTALHAGAAPHLSRAPPKSNRRPATTWGFCKTHRSECFVCTRLCCPPSLHSGHPQLFLHHSPHREEGALGPRAQRQSCICGSTVGWKSLASARLPPPHPLSHTGVLPGRKKNNNKFNIKKTPRNTPPHHLTLFIPEQFFDFFPSHHRPQQPPIKQLG